EGPPYSTPPSQLASVCPLARIGAALLAKAGRAMRNHPLLFRRRIAVRMNRAMVTAAFAGVACLAALGRPQTAAAQQPAPAPPAEGQQAAPLQSLPPPAPVCPPPLARPGEENFGPRYLGPFGLRVLTYQQAMSTVFQKTESPM